MPAKSVIEQGSMCNSLYGLQVGLEMANTMEQGGKRSAIEPG